MAIRALAGCSNGRPGLSSAVVRGLSTGLLLALGAMSYSLYLVHYPVLSAVDLASRRLGMGIPGRHAVQLIVGLPAALACGYAFHRMIEVRLLARRWSPVLPGIQRRRIGGVERSI